MYGVPGKNWHTAPASTPMTAARGRLGRMSRIARQYIAMMKFGFMPPMLMTEPAKNLSTAPAASRTAVRIRLRKMKKSLYVHETHIRTENFLRYHLT